jgi:phosphoglycolate phosphatase
VDLIIFDLDGTLVDSRIDLVNAANATRRHLGYEPLSADLVASYVGHGAPVLIRRVLGGEQAMEQEVERGLEFFLEYYGRHLLDQTSLYPGVRDTLEHLSGAGVPLAILTNKPEGLSRAIVTGLGVSPFFFRIYGGDSLPHKKPDPIGIDKLIAETAAARRRTLMVGDSHIDIKTARNAGVVACGVTFGLQPETLTADPPDILIHSMPQLLDSIARVKLT